jgi:CHASE2 domain-containing sensor protein
MISERRFFGTKRTSLFALAACIFEAALSARMLNRPASSVHDAIHILALVFSSGILIVLGFRSSIGKERLLFGAVAIALVLWTILAVVLPSAPTTYILRWLIFMMWIVAVGSGVSILLGANRSRVGTQ